MENLIEIIYVISFLILILAPLVLFFIVKKYHKEKFYFLTYLMLGIVITGAIIWIFNWWSDYSKILLVEHYNGYVYNPDTGQDEINYENILPENIERVKKLERSIMGIGWPLRAIMSLIIYSPYLIIIYLIGELIIKRKLTKHKKI